MAQSKVCPVRARSSQNPYEAQAYHHSRLEVEARVSILSGLGDQGAGHRCTAGSSWGSLPRSHILWFLFQGWMSRLTQSQHPEAEAL